MATSEFVNQLKLVFEQRKAKNPRYSQRAFASSLGLHSAALSTILSGKRKVSAELASKILDKLGVEDQRERLRILGPSLGLKRMETPVYTDVDLARFAVVRDWEHSAILASFEIDPRLKIGVLAQRLGLSEARVKSAMDRLVSVGLLERRESGWHSVLPCQATVPETPSADVRAAHRQFLEKAMESLEKDPPGVRDITGITVTVSPRKMPEAREAIREFRRRLAQLVDDGREDREVYRLNVQLFPLARGHRR